MHVIFVLIPSWLGFVVILGYLRIKNGPKNPNYSPLLFQEFYGDER